MDLKILLNDFATRSFRDVADLDYIAARLSYRHGLYSQFHWQSLQAIEKYLKAILLYNRIKAKNINHNLEVALKYSKKLPFDIARSESTENFLSHLSNYGRFRYLESSYFIRGPKLVELDRSVWEIRRYCRVLNYDLELRNGESKNMLDLELEKIERSDLLPPQKFRLVGGLLDKIVDKRDHLSRPALIWQNAFFGIVTRNRVTVPVPTHAVNSPLSLHPEMLDELLDYVFLPKEVVNAYRALSKKK